MPSGLISTSSGSTSARRISATSLGNGAAESPWKERVQSIFSSGGESGERGASARPVLEMLVVVWWVGVGARMRAVRSSVVGVLAGAVDEEVDVFAGRVGVEGMGVLGAVRVAGLLLLVMDLVRARMCCVVDREVNLDGSLVKLVDSNSRRERRICDEAMVMVWLRMVRCWIFSCGESSTSRLYNVT